MLIPIGITLYLTKFFIQVSEKLIPQEINPNNYLQINGKKCLLINRDITSGKKNGA